MDRVAEERAQRLDVHGGRDHHARARVPSWMEPIDIETEFQVGILTIQR